MLVETRASDQTSSPRFFSLSTHSTCHTGPQCRCTASLGEGGKGRGGWGTTQVSVIPAVKDWAMFSAADIVKNDGAIVQSSLNGKEEALTTI